MNTTPTARGRLAGSLMAVAGAVITTSPLLLAAGYVFLLPVLLIGAVFRAHLRFLVIVVLPVAAFALVVWPFVMGAPPGEIAGSNPAGAFRFASATVLRLMFVGGVVQACVLAIHSRDLATTFRRWGLRGEWLIAALGATVLAPEMKRRADRVFTAALARGLLPNRSIWSRLRVLPTTLMPLTAWSLRAAISRADNWHERKLLDRVDALAGRPDPGSLVVSGALVVAAIIWLCASISLRWRIL
jgi:energy-coupling factor transporter transmembrane protein EcfT